MTNGYDVSADSAVGQRNRLYRNDGGAGLVEVTTGTLATSTSISSGHTWGDYDNDGDLDVFIANQQDQDNLLFRNEGHGNFTQVTDAPQATDGGHSYTATWVDVDADGWLDLFVANGGMSHVGANGLYRGTGDGHFEKVTEGAIVTDEAATCGIAWGDYDNDGDLDLFVANTGFAPPGNHNALYRNDGNWSFTRLGELPVVTEGKPSSAAAWLDIDNDLDLDLYVASHVRPRGASLRERRRGRAHAPPGLSPLPRQRLPLRGEFRGLRQRRRHRRRLRQLGRRAGLLPKRRQGATSKGSSPMRSPGTCSTPEQIASGDYDGDGNVDVYIGNWPNHPGEGEPNALYRNTGAAGHWLAVRLVGNVSNRAGIGARVVVTTSSGTQMREVTSAGGFPWAERPVSAFRAGGRASGVRRGTLAVPGRSRRSRASAPIKWSR